MINLFGGQTDPVIQENCRKRLAHLTELEHDLSELMRKLPTISALKHSAGRYYVCPNSIQVVQKSCKLISDEAITLLSKAAEYSNDRTNCDARVISAVKVKSELDLFPYCLPLEEHVLNWAWNGIDSDQKGKDHSKLLEEEFTALLREVQLQSCKFPGKLPALAKIVDGTLEAFMAHHSSIQEDSDIIQRFTEFLMTVLAKLKEANLFDAGRAAKVKEIIKLLVDDEASELSSLKLRLLMTVSVAEQQDIVKDLTLLISDQNDIATLSSVMNDIKLFKAPLIPLYDPVFKRYADKPSDSQFQKVTLAICMAELAKSANIQSDTWVMQQLDLISNMTKTSYTADIADTFMKAAKDAIDLIIVKIMPRLEALLLEDKETVLAVLKRFQIFTRNVQILCNHVKSSKDKGLLKRIPPLKKSLEVSLLRVKQMLQANNCIGAFWVGNLKHKGLDGKEVESHIPLKRDVVDDEEDEIAACDTTTPSEVEEEEMAEESDEDPTLAISL